MRNAGAFNQRVVIETPTTSTDAVLGRSETWSTLATIWAEVTPTAADERMDGGQQIGSYMRWSVKTDYRADVTPKMRMTWNGKTLYVLGSAPAGLHLRESIVFRCEERT